MADWKAQISYNYNPSYHAYAYGLVYQPGPEQNNGNLSSWGEASVMDLSSYKGGITQSYYAASSAKTRDDSPPGSPEQHEANGHCQYRGSGVVYVGDAQAGRLLLAAPQQANYDSRANEVRRARSESASDSEAHASPDSWRSGSSREGCFPQADPATWAKKDQEDDVPNTLVEEPQPLSVIGNQNTNTTSLHVPIPAPKKPSTTAVNNTKGKVRSSFSESQMSALVHRFSVQRYLTPAEMKNLAELNGLTYKQVKTWFQNRRMKLRRHQKDTSWVCERYTINKDAPVHGTLYNNVPSYVPPYQGEAQPQLKEHYNQDMMDVAFRKTAPQNLAFYLAAMGGTAGSTGYPSWSSNTSQSALPTRPQVAGWSMPPGVGHYEYNPDAFNPAAANNTVHDTSFESQDGEPVSSCSSFSSSVAQNANQ